MVLSLSRLRIGKNEWVAFALTLIATLTGVLIAIWLTSLKVKSKEKGDTIKLLNTAKSILINTCDYSKGLKKSIHKFENDTINYSKASIESIKARNPVPYPDLFETLLSSELVAKNMSEHSLNGLYNQIINFRKLSNHVTIVVYIEFLEDAILLLDLEMKLLNGEISPKEKVSIYEDAIQKADFKENKDSRIYQFYE